MPGLSVLLNFPNRSTTNAVFSGTILCSKASMHEHQIQILDAELQKQVGMHLMP